jgi:thiamine biosynthesis lipoprotein
MWQEYNYHTRVMGCGFDMTFIAKTVAQADKYFIQANEIAKSYEKRFSRFDKNSELSLVNEKKSARVSRDFLEVYWVAYHLYKETQAQFNPLLQVSNIGYDKSFEKMDNSDCMEVKDVSYNTNLDDVTVLRHQIILQDSQKLDFGGFLKGYVAQKIAQSIKSNRGVIINIGGDMYVRGGDKDRKKFIVEIVHPVGESKNISFSILNKSLCTSGTYKRKWKTDNGSKHHILDSSTKDCTKTNLISASVVHSKGAVADAYATIAITLGLNGAKEFLERQGNVDFVLIDKKGDILKSDNIRL